MTMPTVTLEQIAQTCGGHVRGRGDAKVWALAPLSRAAEGHISFINHSRWLKEVFKCAASVIIIKPEWEDHQTVAGRNLLVHEQPHRVVLRVVEMLHAGGEGNKHSSIHPTALVHPSARVGKNSAIGPYTVVEEHASIGDHVQVGPHCSIGERVSIGPHSWIDAHVTVYRECLIGRNCILHAGVVIGGNGFYFDRFERGWERLPAVGTVFIGDNVEIGANSTIDRGVVDDTILGNGVKLDNLIQIAHDVRIGDRCIIAACTGVAGGTQIGSDSKISGKVGVSGNLFISSGVQIFGGTLVAKSIKSPGGYSGHVPFAEHSVWRENFSLIRRLAQLRRRVIKLEQNIEGCR